MTILALRAQRSVEDYDKALRRLIDELETAVWALGEVVRDRWAPRAHRAEASAIRAEFEGALTELRSVTEP